MRILYNESKMKQEVLALRNKKIIMALTVLVGCLVVFVSASHILASNTVDLTSVLGGTVMASQLAVPGSNVSEGSVLVTVQTIVGSAPAVRATVDGKIAEVLVKPGDVVKPGDILVRIIPSSK